MKSEAPDAFVSATNAGASPPQSVEELEAAARRATAATQRALQSFLEGSVSEAELEILVRAEAEARFAHYMATKRPELEQTVQQMMGIARQKFRETASLRDPRAYARGRG